MLRQPILRLAARKPLAPAYTVETILMQKLVEGIHHFQNDTFSSKQRLFEGLVDGQQPLALFITCSDSRIDPNLLTQSDPGELFILRNAGNIVPPYGAVEGGEAATIEYAVSVLGVKDIIVCGHSHCGAMGALLDPSQLAKLPAVRSWLGHAESTQRIIEENYAYLSDDAARLTATVEENVLVQLEHLRTHPAVAAALGRQALNLHGWVYKFETGQVFGYNPQHGQFVPVEGTSVTPPADGRELPPI
jgi:carbonic anhydrase